MIAFPLMLTYAALAAAGHHARSHEVGAPMALPLTVTLDPRTSLEPVARDIVNDRESWYVQIGAGLVTTSDSDGPDEDVEFDEGFGIPLAVGYRFGADDDNAFAFDLELEALYNDQDADNEGFLEAVNDVTVLAGFIDGVGDLALGQNFSIYGGAGIGLAALDIGTESDGLNSFDDEDGPFLAWQGKAGFRWYATPSVSWSAGYRFVNVDDAEIDDDLGGASFDLETEQHMLELGLRFSL
jgi:opacity protein-like surface antigen